MRPNRYRSLVLVVLFAAALPIGAWDEVGNGCPYTADDVAPRIKAVLGPRYADERRRRGARSELPANSRSCCSTSATAAPWCSRASARTATRQAHIGEWHALNQWLYRLVNFVGQNARGDDSVSWREEYALFAEVYEFEP